MGRVKNMLNWIRRKIFRIKGKKSSSQDDNKVFPEAEGLEKVLQPIPSYKSPTIPDEGSSVSMTQDNVWGSHQSLMPTENISPIPHCHGSSFLNEWKKRYHDITKAAQGNEVCCIPSFVL